MLFTQARGKNLPSSVYQKIKELCIESAVYGLPPVLQRFISLLTFPVFTRILTPADYGIMGMMASISAFASIFVVLGLDSAVALYYYDAKDKVDRRITVTTWIYFYFGTSLVLAAALWLVGDQLATRFLGSPRNGDIVRLAAATMLLTRIEAISWNLLRIQRRKWWVVGLTGSNLVLITSFSLLLVVTFRQGVRGIYFANFLAAIPYFLVNLWIVRSWLSVRWFSIKRLRELLAFGLPLVPASLAYWTIELIDRFFLEHYQGLSDVGLFAIGSSIAAAIAMLVSAFQQAWGPFAISIKEDADAQQTYAKILTYYLLLASGAGVILSVLTPELLSMLTPKTYQAAVTVVGYLAFASIGYGVYYIAAIGVNLVKKTSHIGWTTIVAAAVTVLLNFLLVPRLGMVGAAIAALLAHWSSAGLLFIVSQRYYHIPYRWREVIIILLTSAVVVGIGARIDTGHLGSTVALKLVWLSSFPGAILLTGIITPKHLVVLSRQVTRTLRLALVRT